MDLSAIWKLNFRRFMIKTCENPLVNVAGLNLAILHNYKSDVFPVADNISYQYKRTCL